MSSSHEKNTDAHIGGAAGGEVGFSQTVPIRKTRKEDEAD